MKNFSYTLTSNTVSMVISAIVILIIPKLIGLEEYGYWQLYLFYSSYVGFLHFGWNEGIYLRYGGKTYKELDKRLFFSQFHMFVAFQLILTIIFLFISYIFISDEDRAYILCMTAFSMLITNVSYMLIYILQGTNRIKEFAKVTILDRIIYCCLIIIFLSLGIRDYQYFILADLVGRFLGLLYAMYFCKEIVFNKISTFYFSFNETIKNITVGIKLLFASIASMLIIGVVRFGIERSWSVAVFGKISLILSISNFLMMFINAIGLVMFPVLRRTSKENLHNIYATMRSLLMAILLGSLIFYYPMKLIFTAWLPDYADSLTYMAILFPMLVFEGKTALLINTFFKTMRLEKLMFKINIISLVLSMLLTFISTIIIKDLTLTILSIIITLAFRSTLGEIYLSKMLGIKFRKDIVFEIFIVVAFIITGWYLDSVLVFVIDLLVYIIYLLIKKEDIRKTINDIRILARGDSST